MKVVILLILCIAIGGTIFAASKFKTSNHASKKPAKHTRIPSFVPRQANLGSLEDPGYELVSEFKRSDLVYTEGLSYKDGLLVESTGKNGESKVQYLRLNEDTKTADIAKQFNLPGQYFGEGHSIVNINGEDKVVMMTYTSKVGLQLDTDLTLIEKTFNMPSGISEGWGMAAIPEKPSTVYISDGTSYVYECDASNNLRIIKSYNFKDITDFMDLYQINELEYVKGKLYANVFLQDYIALLDFDSQKAVKTYYMTDLIQKANIELKKMHNRYLAYDEVLNGIAYNPDTDTFYVTGKNWPLIFEIRLNQ